MDKNTLANTPLLALLALWYLAASQRRDNLTHVMNSNKVYLFLFWQKDLMHNAIDNDRKDLLGRVSNYILKKTHDKYTKAIDAMNSMDMAAFGFIQKGK